MEQVKKIDSKKLLLIIGGVVVVILAVSAYIIFFTDVGKNPKVLLTEKKAEMLEIVSNAKTVPLSGKQKAEILQNFGGDKTTQYNFTPAEQEQILRALNGK